MIGKRYDLWGQQEYNYPAAGRFIPNITSYIHEEDNIVRPAIVIVPGGGYCFVSHSEGEIVAEEFYKKGYQAFVVTYTTNFLMEVPLKWQPLKDLSKAVVFVRKNADEFRVDPNRLFICGFSAGGHLCGSLGVHYKSDKLLLGGEYTNISNRPDGMILSYPVISSGEHAHRGSFQALLGMNPTFEELESMSLEKQITRDTPPTFIWHTATDDVVPVENSYLFAQGCKNNSVAYELHVFRKGKHGMSLANEKWAKGDYGGHYSLEQLYNTIQQRIDKEEKLPYPFHEIGDIKPGTDAKGLIKKVMNRIRQQEYADASISIWPDLVENWITELRNQ